MMIGNYITVEIFQHLAKLQSVNQIHCLLSPLNPQAIKQCNLFIISTIVCTFL